MAPRNDNRSAHKRRIATANSINKVYKRSYNRRNIQPRGLENPGNYCYRNATLQTLAHLPRFVNWIMEHSSLPHSPKASPKSSSSPKSPTSPPPPTSPQAAVPHPSTEKKWVCKHDDPNRRQPVPRKGDEDIVAKMGPYETGCVPCLLKNLFRKYWKKHQMDPEDDSPDSKPLPFDADDEALLKLHNLADRWFCRDPEGWGPRRLAAEEKSRKAQNKRITKENREIEERNREAEEENQRIMRKNKRRNKKGKEDLPLEELEELEELWNIPMTDQDKEDYRIEQRRLQSTGQQCVDEYMMFIFGGIEASYDIKNAHGQRRNNQLDSLFTITRQQWSTCLPCGQSYKSTTVGEKGFNILPDTTGTDSIPAAIVRMLSDTVDGVDSDCGNGCKNADQTREWIIEAAPEYLRIPVTVENWDDETGESVKNLAAYDIPDILDLTEHMQQTDDLEPARYRLLHVIYHQGTSVRGGHYAAGVTSPDARHAGRLEKGETRPRAPQWFCNDSVVTRWNRPAGVQNKLTINPVNRSTKKVSESDYNPRILWYVREPAPAKEKGEVEVEAVSEGGIAKRVTGNPRQNRGTRVRGV